MTVILEGGNQLVYDAVLYGLVEEPSDKRVKDDATFSDFDGTRLKVEYVKEAEGMIEDKMRVSLQCKALRALRGKGLEEVLEEKYSGMLVEPEEGCEVTLQFNIDADIADKEAMAMKVSLLKCHAMGAALYKSFQALATAKGPLPASEPVQIQHRPEESYWVITGEDKVIVAYSMHFVDDDERVIGELVLKGFGRTDAKLAGSAPVVRFSDSPPAELEQLGIGAKDGATDWLTTTYFATHVATAEKLENAVAQAQNFRTFVSFHVKAAKTYMSSKMRTRVDYFQKVLDRAIPAKDSGKGIPSLMAVGVAGKVVEKSKKRRA